VERLSEVCNKLGVSRRVLQEYDRLDIAKHSEETEGGYWLYSDEDIKVVATAILFAEAGYKRKEIKKILELPTKEQKILYRKLLHTIEEKKRRIEWLRIVSCIEQ